MRIVESDQQFGNGWIGLAAKVGKGGLSDPAAPRNDHCFAFSVCLPAVFAITRWLADNFTNCLLLVYET